MTPISLVLCNFLKHRALTVDFTVASLISFSGPNGSGKSTIFEGIRFALYGAGRGKADEMVKVGETDMSTTLVFAHGGQRYRVTRIRTTRAGGKSSLELAIALADGWRPLTGDDMRTTQAAIERLLRLDVDVFDVAVLLGQGKANRFGQATAAERKRIFEQLVVDPRFALAEARARELARELERDTAAQRTQLDRLLERLEDEDLVRAGVDHWSAKLALLGQAQVLATVQREKAQVALRELAGRLVAAEADRVEQRRLQGEITTGLKAYAAAEQRRMMATAAVARAAQTLETAPEVEAAAQRLVSAQATVDALRARETSHATLTTERARWRDRVLGLEREYERELEVVERARAVRDAAVASLEASVARLTPVTCPRCAHSFPADPARLAAQLAEARRKPIPTEPAQPLGIIGGTGQMARIDAKLVELAFDPADLEAARAQLMVTERLAARAGEVAATRASMRDGQQAQDAAREELAAITAAGQATRVALQAVLGRLAAAADLSEQQSAQQAVVEAAGQALDELARQRTAAQTALARAEAQAEELVRVQAEADALAGTIDERAQEATRLAKLVKAFGVTGIPARIIESVLPELAGYANELLEHLRPGMRLELRAQRAKKSGDGLIEALDLVVIGPDGEMGLHMYSGGETISVSLALAVALSRLVARRSGTAIRFLGIDEPDGLDRPSRRELRDQLGLLTSRGLIDLIAVVTHHEDLAEGFPASYRLPDMELVA